MTILASMRSTAFWGITAPYKNVAPTIPALFEFTTHTFTTGSTVGRYGPALSTLRSAYSSQSWASNSAFFTQGRAQGYQVFTIPATGIYEIEAAGARGQNSASINGGYGRGAIIRARISLNRGDSLEMVVGQVPGNGGSTNPGNSYAGAGGGSFVAFAGTSTPVIVAGGGGGSYSGYPSQAIVDGQTRQQPRWDGYNYNPASLGTHPQVGYGGPGYHGGGGGGFFGHGTAYPGRSISDSSMTTDGNGQQYTSGAGFIGTSSGSSLDPVPGTWYALGGNATALTSEGGFGGGGGGHSGNNTGGAGGGYSGGLGGQTSLGGSVNTGTGGGSFVIPTATSIATSNGQYDGSTVTNIGSFNDGSGYIRITLISSDGGSGGGSGGSNVQAFTNTSTQALASGTYNYFVMGGGGSGAGSHYPGGGAGRIATGTFTHAGGNVTFNVATASLTAANASDQNLSGIQGYSSSIVFNGGTITAAGGDGGWGDTAAPGASVGTNPWASGSSGGGGGGNAGFGGAGGTGGNSGASGATYSGGTGMGTGSFNTAISFLQTGLRTTYTSASVTAGAGGAASSGSHQGGGGGGGIIISNVSGISTPSVPIGTTLDGHAHGQPGLGWGAGGGAAGYNGQRGSTGQGLPGIIIIWQ